MQCNWETFCHFIPHPIFQTDFPPTRYSIPFKIYKPEFHETMWISLFTFPLNPIPPKFQSYLFSFFFNPPRSLLNCGWERNSNKWLSEFDFITSHPHRSHLRISLLNYVGICIKNNFLSYSPSFLSISSSVIIIITLDGKDTTKGLQSNPTLKPFFPAFFVVVWHQTLPYLILSSEILPLSFKLHNHPILFL